MKINKKVVNIFNILYTLFVILAASIVIFLFLMFCKQTSENKVKTDIKRQLYISNVAYKDEYVDLWYDIMNNPCCNEIVVNQDTIYPTENTNDLIKCKINIEKMIDTCNKLINIYGSDFENIFYMKPFCKIDTLNDFKVKCGKNIKIIQNILDKRQKEEQGKEELEKITYGND